MPWEFVSFFSKDQSILNSKKEREKNLFLILQSIFLDISGKLII